MPIVNSIFLALVLLTAPSQREVVIMPIPTSDAIDLARMIARNEGYDVTKTTIYSFDLLTSQGKPFHAGYTSIGFDINGNTRNLISINDSTGQAIDYNTCEIFDYPD